MIFVFSSSGAVWKISIAIPGFPFSHTGDIGAHLSGLTFFTLSRARLSVTLDAWEFLNGLGKIGFCRVTRCALPDVIFSGSARGKSFHADWSLDAVGWEGEDAAMHGRPEDASGCV